MITKSNGQDHLFSLNKNYKLLKSYLSRHGLQKPEDAQYFPKFLQIETVSLCNGKCVMCPVGEWNRSERIMDMELYRKIISDITPYTQWIERVTIQLDGEPLMDRYLEERIKLLKKTGIKTVAFSTNGSLLDERRGISVIHSGVDEVSFSVDGVTPYTFETIRKGLKFETCIGNIKRFIELRDSLAPSLRIRIRMTIQEENIYEFRDLVSYWKDLTAPGDEIYGKLMHTWGNWLQGIQLFPIQNREGLNETPCISPWSSIVILSDGRVPLCCNDFNASILLGNVRSDHIQDIWQSRVLKKIRNSQLKKGRRSMKLCLDCNTWDYSSRIGEDHPIITDSDIYEKELPKSRR